MVSVTLLSLAVQAVAVLAHRGRQPRGDKPTATLDAGVVVGTTTAVPGLPAAVNHYLGIPFAEKPVRFSPPEPVKSWKGELDVAAYKPACIQQFNYPEAAREATQKLYNNPPPPAGEDEDCLQINVITPAKSSKKLRPVMFWIYGGDFVFGTGTQAWYEGSSFAANQDVIIVTSNYRVNVFGFPSAPELDLDKRNIGLLDQRLALDWVQRNIAKFGGDPKQVTIFGESAGAGSVDLLISAPPDPLPFRAAIMQSGQSAISQVSNSTPSWTSLLEHTNCTNATSGIDCVRQVPATEIKDIIERNQLIFKYVKDNGVTVANTPRQTRSESTEGSSIPARVPVLIGNNADEGAAFSFSFSFAVAAAYLSMGVDTANFTQKLNKSYAIGSPGIADETEQVRRLVADLLMNCATRQYSDESSAVGIDTWRYYYNGTFPGTDPYPNLGAWHAAEINIVFDTYDHAKGTPFQAELSAKMQKVWADFAKDPTHGPGWDKVNEVAVFGFGSGDDKAALQTVDAAELDTRCKFITPFYAAIGDNGISGLS